MRKYFLNLLFSICFLYPTFIFAAGEKEIIINTTPKEAGFLLEVNLENLPKSIFAIAFDFEFDGADFDLASTRLNLENSPEEYLFLSKKSEKSLHFSLSAKKGHLLKIKADLPLLELETKTRASSLNLTLSNLYIFETIADFEIYRNIKDIRIKQNNLEGVKRLPLAGESDLFFELKRFALINLLLVLPILLFIFYMNKKKEKRAFRLTKRPL